MVAAGAGAERWGDSGVSASITKVIYVLMSTKNVPCNLTP